MKRYRFADLKDIRDGHFLKGIVPGDFIHVGGLGFKKPGERSHAAEGHAHVHDDCEVFVILQGKGEMEINGRRHPVTTGDIIVVEPGEDHHLIADLDDPCINLWCHAGPGRHGEASP
jgi:mannose-6-phosphate isomerase-like protein (cupin superfamily)